MSNPNITQFMADQNISSYSGLEEYYISKLLDIVANLPTQNGYGSLFDCFMFYNIHGFFSLVITEMVKI